MRILFLNHTSAASGAEFALLSLVRSVRSDHRVAVACPPGGPLVKLLDESAIERVSVPAFEASLRLDPVHTPASVLRLGASGLVLARAARRFGADLIHANTPRAGLMAALARRAGGPPLVVRAHESIPHSVVGRRVRSALEASASAILTVSQDIARSFNEGFERPPATHLYNGFERRRFDPGRVDPAGVRTELGIPPQAPLLAHVAQITPWKGQDTSIRALAQLHRAGVPAHLLIVGGVAFSGRGVRYDNPRYLREIRALVDELGLSASVHFLGRRGDVPGILKEADLSLLPSWDEPFANVMLESMAMRTPLLVSQVGGGPELVEDEISGRLLHPRRPEVWAAAIAQLLADRTALARMGDRAHEATANFSIEAHSRAMLRVYELVLEQGEQDPARLARAFRRSGAAETNSALAVQV